MRALRQAVAALALWCLTGAAPVHADVRNEAQDESFARAVSGPVDRFTSHWRVDCRDAPKRCAIELETRDRLGPGHTVTIAYSFRVVVERAKTSLEFPWRKTVVPEGRKVALVIDGTTAATFASGERLDDPRLFDWMFRSVELAIESGSFADPPRLRESIMLEGLQDAIEQAQAELARGGAR